MSNVTYLKPPRPANENYASEEDFLMVKAREVIMQHDKKRQRLSKRLEKLIDDFSVSEVLSELACIVACGSAR